MEILHVHMCACMKTSFSSHFKGSLLGYLSKANHLHKKKRNANFLIWVLISMRITSTLSAYLAYNGKKWEILNIHQLVQEAFSNKHLWIEAFR